MQHGAAARRDCVDRHHRRAHAHTGHRGLERAFEPAGIKRDIGRGAAHVEADDLIEPGHSGRPRRADDTARRAGQDRVLALEPGGVGQAAIRLHEIEPHAAKLGRYLLDVAAQDRREVGVDNGGVAARDQPQQRADCMAGGDLRETGLPREFRQAPFMIGIFPGVHQDDGAGADARRRARCCKRLRAPRPRPAASISLAVDADPPARSPPHAHRAGWAA